MFSKAALQIIAIITPIFLVGCSTFTRNHQKLTPAAVGSLGLEPAMQFFYNPYCGASRRVFTEIVLPMTDDFAKSGSIYLEFIGLPIKNSKEETHTLLGAICASQQNVLLPYLKKVMGNTTYNISFDPNEILAHIVPDSKKAVSCMASDETLKIANAGLVKAEALKMDDIPRLFYKKRELTLDNYTSVREEILVIIREQSKEKNN